MKLVLKTLIATGLAATAISAIAAFPEKPIRLVVPLAAGGGVDVIGRVLAQGLAAELGQPVIVDNKPGAGGTLGADLVAKSAADGYTLLFASMAHQSFHPLLYKHLPYDAYKAFAPVATVAAVPNVLVVSKRVQATNVKELVVYARANPRKLFMGSAGNGSVNHLVGELFQYTTGVDFEHVPYKGAGPAAADLAAGQLDLLFVNVPTVMAFIKSGKIRPLAVASEQRSAMLPDVPTFAEAGVPNYVVDSWFAVLAPAATPQPVMRRLSAAINRVLKEKATVDALAVQGARPIPGGAAEYETRNRREMARWSDVIRKAGVTVE